MFYFRAFIPRNLQCKIGLTQIKISLKTAYLAKARSHARHLSARVEHIFSAIDGGIWNDMDSSVIKELAMKYLHEVTEADERQRAAGRQRSTAAAIRYNEIIIDNIAADREALATNDYQRIHDDVIGMIADSEADALIRDRQTYNTLCREILKARIEAHEILAKRELGLYEDATPAIPATTAAQPASTKSEAPLFSKAVEAYIKEHTTAERGKARWNISTKDSHMGTLNTFPFVFGDIKLDTITEEVIEKYKQYMLIAPKNVAKKPQYRNKKYHQIIKMNIPDADKMSDLTLKDHFYRMRTFFEWANERYRLSIPHKHALQIRLNINPQEQRKAYEIDELQMIFSSESYTKSQFKKAAYFWMPLLATFTGARLEELCQLYITDFRQAESGRWYISINNEGDDKQLKNATASRIVPIHDTLIDLGLIERAQFLKSKGIERLFPELKKTPTRDKFGADVSRWFTTFRLQIGLGGTDNKTTFHSFRHTFINWFKQQGYENTETWATLQEVVGHSRGTSMTSSRYSKALNADIAYERVIGRLDYGIDLSHLKNSQYIQMIKQ